MESPAAIHEARGGRTNENGDSREPPDRPAGPGLLRGFGDGAALEGDRRLREEPAVDRCAGPQLYRRLRQHDLLGVRRCSELHVPGDLPDDVLGLGPADQRHRLGGNQLEIARDLEDPDVVEGPGERDVGGQIVTVQVHL